MALRTCLFLVASTLSSLRFAASDEVQAARNPTRQVLQLPETSAALADSFDEQWEKFFAADQERRDHEEPLTVYGGRLIELAQKPGDASFFATTYLMRIGNGVAGDAHHVHLLAGFNAILRHHKDNPHLTAELDNSRIGQGGLPEVETEDFLRRLLASSENRAVRAGAAYALAAHLDALATLKPRIRGVFESFLDAELPVHQLERLRDHLADRDPNKLRDEARELLRFVIDNYPNERPSVRTQRGWSSFPRSYEVDEDGSSYGELSARLLFEVNHLREGCEAPDIVGRDAAGEKFRLSDYRGKVVLLMFSYKGCTACEGMYPKNRQLLETFSGRPFAVLTVMASFIENETIATLKEAKASGKITWRCWWDGPDNRIANRWNVAAWPEPYLIDSRGVIQRYPSSGDQGLEDAIAALLDEVG